MIKYDLINTPNQSFSTQIGGNVFEFSFRTFRDIMYCSVSINGEMYHSGVKAVPNENLFSISVNRIAEGEFKFVCTGDDYPNYTNLGGADCAFTFSPYNEQ